MIYGASPTDWLHFADTLGLASDLLPVVSDPTAKINKESTLVSLGKVPSTFSFDGTVFGIGKWTSRNTTTEDIAKWAGDSRYGICVQTRQVIAFDCDDEETTDTVVEALRTIAPDLCYRGREGTNRKLVPLLLDERSEFKHYRALRTSTGVIEMLSTGQQFIAVGTHTSGQRYEWHDAQGLTTTPIIATCSAAALQGVWEHLVATIAISSTRATAPVRDRATTLKGALANDPVGAHLIDSGWGREETKEGALNIHCPFKEDHSTGDISSSTTYFPRFTNGYERGFFKCLHAHCAERRQEDFLRAIGYAQTQFPVALDENPRSVINGAAHIVGDEVTILSPIRNTALTVPHPVSIADFLRTLPRNTSGRIPPTAKHLTQAIAMSEFFERELAFDGFASEIVVRPFREKGWRALRDTDYLWFRVHLEESGFASIDRTLLHESVDAVAENNRIDTAQAWIQQLVWDGVPRVSSFVTAYLGAVSSDYNIALGRYLWTALAGRCSDPGVKVDMMIILQGRQGIRKSTAIASISPAEDYFFELNFNANDTDVARLMRGKLVAEAAELKGLGTRDVESIRAFLSRQHEKWVPKYKEFATSYARRCVIVGSTNEQRYLDDPAGTRRFLPLALHRTINTTAIVRDRNQLWAEAYAMYSIQGIAHLDADEKSGNARADASVVDPWSDIVNAYFDRVRMQSDLTDHISSTHLYTTVLGIETERINKSVQIRASRVMRDMGFESYRISAVANSRTQGYGWRRAV